MHKITEIHVWQAIKLGGTDTMRETRDAIKKQGDYEEHDWIDQIWIEDRAD